MPLGCAILVEPQNYESIKIEDKSNFENAICDRMDFIYRVSKSVLPESIPKIVKNKKELKSILGRRIIDKQRLDSMLNMSRLPEE